MAATQRPVAESVFGEKNGPSARKKLPSWAVVATGDKAAGGDVVMSMAQRAGAQITEVDASHVPMISHPSARRGMSSSGCGAAPSTRASLGPEAAARVRRRRVVVHRQCLLVILNEEWEHRLYAEPDLDILQAPSP
jgi:hypothetical protein